jgi:hypothetical protein
MILKRQNEADAKIEALLAAVARLQANRDGRPLDTAKAELEAEVARQMRIIGGESDGNPPDETDDPIDV